MSNQEMFDKIMSNLLGDSETFDKWDALQPADSDYMLFSPTAVGYNSTAEQIYLFQNLLIGFTPESSILDIGCGRADMRKFINELYDISPIYTGVDLNPLMSDAAKRKYDYDIIVGNFETTKFENHDWVVASGVFTERRCETEQEDMQRILDNIDQMYQLANSVVSFNLLSPINTKQYDGFFYVHPGLILDILIEKYQYVLVRHNYSKDVFTVTINKTK